MKRNFTFTVGILASLLIASGIRRTFLSTGEIVIAQPGSQIASASAFKPKFPPLPDQTTLSNSSKSEPAEGAETLKGSDWYKTVINELERKSYFVAASGDSVNSINPKQQMQAVYRSDGFTLSNMPERQDPEKPGNSISKDSSQQNWKLDLNVQGLYADGALAISNDPNAVVATDTSEVTFTHHNQLIVQYQNREDGVRQNFIVKNEPFANVKQLRVRIGFSEEWTVNQTNQSELQFALENADGRLGTRVIYKDIRAWDAYGNVLAAKMEKGNDHDFSLVVAVANAAYPVTIDPLSNSANTILTGPSANAYFGCSVASAGDVNADGYGDVIVGAYGLAANAGAAYIYMGSATGLSTTPARVLNGPANSYFGYAVAGAGDVNGDGRSDVIVGAYQYSNYAGAAYIYYGTATGLNATPAAILTGTAGSMLGVSVSAIDLNADAYSDIIIGSSNFNAGAGRATVHLGKSAGISQIPDYVLAGTVANGRFGCSVAGAGDVNGDVFGDLIIGASEANKAYIYHGNADGMYTSVASTLTSPAFNTSYGLSVSGAGDVDGDGYCEVIVGAYANNAAYVYKGSPTGTQATPVKSLSGYGGVSVAGVGDVNGDGYADVMVGASRTGTFAGSAYLFQGSASGLPSAPSQTFQGSAGYYSYFGCSVAAAGDINGDGYSDAIVGSSGASSNTGYAYIFLGSPDWVTSAATSLTGTGDFGYSVAHAGDMNGDGYGDVVVGAIFNSTSHGFVYLYLGSAGGLATSASSQASTFVHDDFGFSLARAGDVNGDGLSDIIVGTLGSAKAYVMYGNAQGQLVFSVTLQRTGEERFGFIVASAGDINADGYDDVIVGSGTVSKAYVYMGSASGVATTPTTTLTRPDTNFGRGAGGIGDINGDGYADVMVAACHEAAQTFPEKAYVYLGSSTGLSNVPSIVITPPSSANGFGSRIASAGDINGDGYGDVIVGAPSSNSGVGAAYVYKGSPSGISSSSYGVLPGPTPAGSFGICVSAGDINRDGYSDVMIGSVGNYYNIRPIVQIFYGSPVGLLYSNTINGSVNGFAFSGSAAGDINGDGYSDIIVGASSANAVFVYMGNGGGKRANMLRLYNSDLTSRISAANNLATNFGVGLFARPAGGTAYARLIWESKPQGVPFSSGSTITNYSGKTGTGTFTYIGATGTELKAIVPKTGRYTKIRVRLEYWSAARPNQQTFGPWIYLQNDNPGVLNKNVPSGRMDASEIFKAPQEEVTTALFRLTVYPNPAVDKLNLKLEDGFTWNQVRNIQIINANGNVMYNASQVHHGELNVSTLPSGIYLIRLVHNGKVYNSRFNIIR